MSLQDDFENLISKLNVEREALQVKLHLAGMEAKAEFEKAEKQWQEVKNKASEIADDTIETSEDFIAKAKIIGEELKDTYQRIAKRLSE